MHGRRRMQRTTNAEQHAAGKRVLRLKSVITAMSTQALVTAEMAKCVDALRMQLFAKGEFGLGKLTGAFAQVDYDGSGNVTRQDFNDVLNYCFGLALGAVLFVLLLRCCCCAAING